VRFEFAGALPLADGRYLARGPAPEEQESVLVLKQVVAPAATSRRRRRAKEVEADTAPRALTLTRATAIRAFEPFADPAEAARWLDEVCEAEDTIDVLVSEGLELLNRALHAQAVAAANPNSKAELEAEAAERVMLGWGSGEEVADSRFTSAREIDMRAPTSRRRRREEELKPQERVAAILRGREQLDACEALMLRARGDLDAGRTREAALQLRVGLEALLVELKDALADPDHERDMATLNERKSEAGAAANTALKGDLTDQQLIQIEELLKLSERVLRRRRVLRG
jgi:hypothetical protein